MNSYGREETVSLIRVVVRNRRRYSRPRASMLPSIAQLTRAAEGVFIVEDVNNIGPNYDPTLLAWEENFRRAWPRFADRSGECGGFICSVARAHFGRAASRSFRFSFPKRATLLGIVSATRDRLSLQRARQFSRRAHSEFRYDRIFTSRPHFHSAHHQNNAV